MRILEGHVVELGGHAGYTGKDGSLHRIIQLDGILEVF